MIYLIQESLTGNVKIGHTNGTTPQSRLGMMQVGNSSELKVIRTLPGGERVEAYLHEAAKHLHIRGEWFQFDELILHLFDHPDIVRRIVLEARVDEIDEILEADPKRLKTERGNILNSLQTTAELCLREPDAS